MNWIKEQPPGCEFRGMLPESLEQEVDPTSLQESVIRPQEARMILAEELRRKYALTSLKPKGSALAVLAINEALEAAAELADKEHADLAASRIRSLKWADRTFAPDSLGRPLPFDKAV